MHRFGRGNLAFLAVVVLLVLSVVLAVTSLYSQPVAGTQSSLLINDTFTLHPGEIRRQGLGAFHGSDNTTGRLGENITLQVNAQDAVIEEFSIVTYNGTLSSNETLYAWKSTNHVTCNFTAGADYYEAIFNSSSPRSSVVHFEVLEQKPAATQPLAALTLPARILFLTSIGLGMVLLIKHQLTKQPPTDGDSLSRLSKKSRRILQALIVLSLIFWLLLLALNTNPLGTFENWYTDHARHPYTASLFLKDGFNVFSQPLDTLASQDSSRYQFVTWPEMPHLYPLGSILLFLPFGVLLQNGFGPLLVYKLEIAVFLVFAHACLYLFLCLYCRQPLSRPQNFQQWKQDMVQLFGWGNWNQKKPLFEAHGYLFLKIIGVYVIYTTLIFFAADGMFDSVALLFSLLGLTAFLTKRYDLFFLFFGVALFFKYQTGIFLLPFVVAAIASLLSQNKLRRLVSNWKIILALCFIVLSFFTAVLSARYLMATRPELVMNGINAFTPHAQISWNLQTFSVLLTLTATLVYATYMIGRNRFLSLSALFLLVPSFMLPYFQNWYLPFLFLYALVPQRRDETVATIVWLIFLMVMLSFGGSAFNPMVISNNFKILING
ncbi:MAG: hypothetical protein NWE92_00460 [Candidatus Bathyarchaeota archaeon]|nr:hypothetical protein [Candidatus Bathyarchaeota archaeon]